MKPKTSADWQKHRELTASALAGHHGKFYELYGYYPKAIYNRIRNQRGGGL